MRLAIFKLPIRCKFVAKADLSAHRRGVGKSGEDVEHEEMLNCK